MMTILSGDDLREQMMEGIDAVADAVKVTLGPRGRNVALPQKANLYGADYGDTPTAGAPVLITNDGVTIAKTINLSGAAQDMGAQLLKEAAIKANDEAGDGTTTAIVLAQALLAGAFKNITSGADPLAIRRGIQKASDAGVLALKAAAIPVSTQDELSRVAAISCQDEALGVMVGEALFKVGLEGVVNVDDSNRLDTELDLQEGIVLERGFVNALMATDEARTTAELHNPYIFLTDKKFTNAQDLIPALICAAEDERDILVVCDGLEDDALALVLRNRLEGDMKVVVIQAPEYGEGRRWRMDDLAVQTGGAYVTEEAGMSVRDVTRAELGSAEYVKVTKVRTVITGGAGDTEAVAERVSQLRYYAENTEYEFNRKRHAERLAHFVSGVAVIRVGGMTEAEQWERKMRVEDAVNATRAALEEGIVAGGGTALLDIIPALQEVAAALTGDEATGARIAIEACKAPAARIAENAGEEGAAVLARLEELPAGTGFDAATRTFVNMVDAGIIDPLRVTRAAYQAAFSLAGTVLLTEAATLKGAKKTVSEALGLSSGGAK